MLIFLCGFLVSTNDLHSQSYVDIGAHVGLANYSGDLSPSNIGPVVSQSHISAGLFFKYNISPRFAGRLAANYAKISGSDALSGSDSQKLRNLSFFSNIFEFSGMLEFNIFKYCVIEGDSKFAPFATVGFGVFNYDPKTTYQGEVVRLQPLGTEGQGSSLAPNNPKYSLFQMNIPFGGGIKAKLSENITATVDLTWRWTFTDYLDDVSTIYPDPEVLAQENGSLAVALSNRTGEFLGVDGYVNNGATRGGPDVNDYYFTGTVGLSYALSSGGSNISSSRRKFRRRKSKVSCPKFN